MMEDFNPNTVLLWSECADAGTAILLCFRVSIYHGELYVDNVLVNTETMTLKVIDFGCGQLVSDCGVQGKYSGHKFAVADTVYSLGVLMVKMVCGHDGWINYDKVLRNDPYMKRLGLSREFLDLKNRCLSVNKPTLEEVLDHEWFKMS